MFTSSSFACHSVLFSMQYGADLVSTVVTAAGAGMTIYQKWEKVVLVGSAMTVAQAFVKMVRQW